MATKMVSEGSGYFRAAKTTTEQGAEALERLICAPELQLSTGLYYDGVREALANEQAYDATARQRLLEISNRLCNIT